VEVNPAAARIAAKRLRDSEIVEATFQEAELPLSSFDLITAWDLVEHLSTPRVWVDKVSRLLKPGGCLIFETGDILSPYSRIAGLSWYYYSILDHSVFYHPVAVKWLLADTPIRIVSIKRSVHAHRNVMTGRSLLAERLKAAAVITYSLRGRVKSTHRIIANILDKDGTLPQPYFVDHILVTGQKL
jgi:SAM-dependent methyltransferase